MGRNISKFSIKKTSLPVTESPIAVTEQASPETMTDAEPIQFDENQSTLQPNREFHTNVTSSYWLPKDEEEQLRLTGQHFAVKELYEGNLLKSIEEKFDFERGISILDVGCGAGQWIMDMINDYPNCTYEGCDIVEAVNPNWHSPQFHFSHGNILEGLNYDDNTFDFVHLRFLILALREEEWPSALKEVLRVTKPGGMIMLQEVDFKMIGGGNPYIKMAIEGIHTACRLRSQNPRIALKLEELANAQENAKVVQVDYRSIDMTLNNSTARKFVWDWKNGIKSMLPKLGPIMGLETEESQQKFLKDLAHALTTSEAYTYINALAIEKTH